LLDQALQRVMTQMVGLSLADIEELHQGRSLAQIVALLHEQPAALSSAMQAVAGAWVGGEVMLQFIGPEQVGGETLKVTHTIDRLLQAPPGTQLFPTSW
jgi:hypothetical protein